MTYTVQVFESIDELDLDDWNQVHELVGDPFTNPYFLRTLQRTTESSAPLQLVIFYDDGTPVAISMVSVCSIDAAILSAGWTRRWIDRVRRVWPGYLRFKMAMCGSPATILQEKLCWLPDADPSEILRLLHEVLSNFARRHGARVLMLGDFDADSRWDTLEQFGYLRGDSLPMYSLELPFDSFDEYLSCLRSRLRSSIRHDRRHFAPPSVEVEHLAGGESAADQFTDEFYELYVRLLDRVEFNFMPLPKTFFQELLRQFGDAAHLQRVFVDGQPAGFTVGLLWHGIYHHLFAAHAFGKFSEELVYFNLNYEAIAHAIERGADCIELGATCDVFKRRLGARHRPRTIYLRVTGWLGPLFRLFSNMLLPPIPLPKQKSAFVATPSAEKIVQHNR